MKIDGKSYTREDLLRRCNPAALYGARRMTVSEGRGKGQGIVEVKTAAGLRLTLLEDKCLDIFEMEYKGVNLGFLSKNGLVNENNPEADTFLKYWQGGFLGTCGLRNVGSPCSVDGEFFPFHGRIGQTAAERVNIQVTDEMITVSGLVRESALFGHCFEMERVVEIPTDGATVNVRDIVRNLTPEEETVLLLYHINFGFPFLSESLVAKFPEGELKGRTPEAEAVLDCHNKFTAPADGVAEHVFFHLPKAERPVVSLSNLGISAEISYNKSELPVLAEWRCMKSGDYALGIEPSTSFIRARAEELENGYDISIPGYGTREFGFCIKLEGN